MSYAEYEVEAIIGKRKFKKKAQYRVKWKGFPVDESTWEPLENLGNAKDAIQKYEKESEFLDTRKGEKIEIQAHEMDRNSNHFKFNIKLKNKIVLLDEAFLIDNGHTLELIDYFTRLIMNDSKKK